MQRRTPLKASLPLSSAAVVFVTLAVGCRVVPDAKDPNAPNEPSSVDSTGAPAAIEASSPGASASAYKDLEKQVDEALRRGATDATAALAELAEIRARTIAVRLKAHGMAADPKGSGTAPAHPERAKGEDASVSDLKHFGAVGFAPNSAGNVAPAAVVLRKIKHARGKLLAKAGRREELVAELAPPGLYSPQIVNGAMRYYQDAESCAPGETVCLEAYRALVKATDGGCRVSPYVSTNFKESGAEAYVCDVENETWYESQKKKKPFFFDLLVRGVAETPKGELVIQGITDVPRNAKTCDGEYQTDKILSATETEIVVERTTWCQGRRTLQLDGRFYVVRLAAGGFAPRAGDSIRVYVRPRDLAIGTRKRVTNVTINRPQLIEVSVPEGTRYRHGTSFEWQFASGSSAAAR